MSQPPEGYHESPQGSTEDPCRRKHKSNKNSDEAFKSIRGRTGEKRLKVLQFITSKGLTGATAEEVSLGTGIRMQSVSARCYELKARGLVFESGKGRLTSSGRNAAVLVASHFQIGIEG